MIEKYVVEDGNRKEEGTIPELDDLGQPLCGTHT